MKKIIKETGDKALIEDKNRYTIEKDGKRKRTFTVTINKEDELDQELMEWIFNQTDFSNSVKCCIKAAINTKGTGNIEIKKMYIL